MDGQVSELNGRLADVQKELVEMTAQRNKAQAETADVTRRLADSESQAAQLSKLRVALAQQVGCAIHTHTHTHARLMALFP